jgi:5-methylcytosine-specific restriction endonuclease McrA
LLDCGEHLSHCFITVIIITMPKNNKEWDTSYLPSTWVPKTSPIRPQKEEEEELKTALNPKP